MKVQVNDVYELLEQVNCDSPEEQVQKGNEKGEALRVQMNDGEKDYVVHFKTLEKYGWYVKTSARVRNAGAL